MSLKWNGAFNFKGDDVFVFWQDDLFRVPLHLQYL
jgi:hypothetical protein